jgi:eukaryotic-like serine/threonine-protein kinase
MSDFLEVLGGYLGRMTSVFSWGNVRVLTGLFVLSWAAVAINRKLGLLSFVGDVASRLLGKPVEGLRFRAEAASSEKSGDFLNAGLAYDRLGDWEKALDCYEKAEEYHLAGELCLKLGHKEVAAEWFLLSDEKMRAAELYRELGRHEKAAEAFTLAGSSLEAAAEYLEAGKHSEAAAIYERAGNLVRAADAHERGSDWRAAATSLAQQVTELESRGSHYRSASQDAEITRLCHRAGRLFEKAGEIERALKLYERGGQLRLAAATAERLGQLRKAAELYRKAGSTEKAAELYERSGDAREAANLLGDERLSGGDALAAAEAFVKGGDLLRAAEVFETAGRFERASECYEKSEAFGEAADSALRADLKGRAADLFVKAERWERAAELYFELGDFDLAALLFSKSGRHFDAARAAAEANSESKMVDYLQRVAPDDSSYLVAVVELARAFSRRGWSSLAQEKLVSVLAGQEVTQRNLELWDELAKAEEDQGHLDAASSILRRIMAVQYNYRAASERYQVLQTLIAQEKNRSETVRSRAPLPAPAGRERRYEVMGMLGQGGMGAVYKAYDHLLKRHVAYKVLAESLSRDPAARDTLLNEARAAAQLNHPNLVSIYDLGFDRGEAFICMELVEGESYQAILRRRGRLEVDEAMHWLVSVCQGLDHAHRRGIVHRDLKPSNVLLSADRRVKILDFGLARPTGNGRGNDAVSDSMSGTPKYISPEAIQGCPTDGRSDVYSLGATLFELLCGRPPFTEGNLLMHHLHTPPPSLRAIRHDTDAKLEELVLLCLSKAPEERFQTAGEVLSFASAARLV